MRLRKVKNASAVMLNSNTNVYLDNPIEHKGKWCKYFNNNNPIHLEIGMGKGHFIIEMANKYPNINFIGIEKYDSVLVKAVKKEPKNKNLCFINANASNLLELFQEHEISLIYLNFSDPWPKSGHKKRRLTNEVFLKIYECILIKNGYIYLKTDNQYFFTYSLEAINNYGMKLENISLDLHQSSFDNVLTEYEMKFSQKGPIYRLEAHY